MCGQQDGETGNGHGDGDEREDEAMFEQIAEEGDDEREGEGGCPWRHGVQLRLDLRVAVCSDDAGGEEGVAVCRHDEAKVHEAAEEDLEVFEDVEHVSRRYSPFQRRFALVFF